MNSRERALATLRCQPTDQLAVMHVTFSTESAEKILGRPARVGGAGNQWKEIQAMWEGPEAHAEYCRKADEDAVDIAIACGHDILRTAYWRWPKHKQPTKKISDREFLFGDPDGEWMKATYHPAEELISTVKGVGDRVIDDHQIGFPEPTPEAEYQAMVEQLEAEAAEYNPSTEPDPDVRRWIEGRPDMLIRIGRGTVAIDYNDPVELMNFQLYRELSARRMMAKAKKLAKNIPSLAAAGLEVYINPADFCSDKGPMISPALFSEVIAPALKFYVDQFHKHDMLYIHGSDGNWWSVADTFFHECGVDGWVELDKSAGMDLRMLRERYPDKAFIGNIRSQVLHTGAPDEVRAETMECLEAAHDCGGIVVGCSNLIMPGTPKENLDTMLTTIAENRAR